MKFTFGTEKQISQNESCLSHPAEIMTVFEPLFIPKKVHYGPKQLEVVLAPAAAELCPAKPQLVPYSHNPSHDSLYQYTQK